MDAAEHLESRGVDIGDGGLLAYLHHTRGITLFSFALHIPDSSAAGVGQREGPHMGGVRSVDSMT